MSVRVGDIGVQIVFDVGESIVGATVSKIICEKPNTQRVEWDATVAGNTLVYTTSTASDLDVDGSWECQALVSKSGWTIHSETARFTVEANL